MLQFLNISDGVTSTPSHGLLDDPLLSVVLDTPAVDKNSVRCAVLVHLATFGDNCGNVLSCCYFVKDNQRLCSLKNNVAYFSCNNIFLK